MQFSWTKNHESKTRGYLGPLIDIADEHKLILSLFKNFK